MGTWVNSEYKNIRITGGTDVTSSALLEDLQKVAAQQVTIKINGKVINKLNSQVVNYLNLGTDGLSYVNNPIVTGYAINQAITNGGTTGASVVPSKNIPVTVTIIPSTGYVYPSSVTVTVANSGTVVYSYNSTTGVVTLSQATDAVTITATCPSDANFILSDGKTLTTSDNKLFMTTD